MISTKTINRRRVTSLVLVATMLFSMLAGTLAFFTDRAETQATATAGTLAINLDDSGINLLDADGKDIMNPGDARDFNYSVKNVGSKSTDIQETIVLTAYDKEGNALPLADTQSEFEIYLASDVTYDATKGWIPNDGAQPITVKALDNNTITYVRPVYTLNGNSELGDDKREIEDGITTDINASELKLVFKAASANKFQGAVLKADLLIEAKQHRNTENVEWVELQTVTHVLSNGNQVVMVPGNEVVINPSEDFEVEDLGNDQIKITGVSSTGAAKDTITVPSTIYDAENDKTYTVTDVDWENVFAGFNGSTIDNSNAPVQPADELVYTMSSDGTKTTINGLTADGKKLTDIEVPTQVNGEDVTINDTFVEDVENSGAEVEIPDEIFENLAAEDIYTYTTDDGSGNTTITGLTTLGKAANTLDIPETLEGMTVTAIQEFALFTTTAENVVIPATITSAPSAFARENVASGTNKSVMNVTINNTIVDNNMFMGCVALDSVTFTAPNTVINGGAFYGCTDLATVNGMENVTSIGDSAFYNCSNLATIDLADVTSIGDSAFEKAGLTEITVPASVASVGAGAFKNCDSLTSITLENDTISYQMFYDCDALEEVTIPSNITAVTSYNHDNSAFANCEKLKTVNIENSVVGIRMFANCDAIESVTIPASVTTYMTNYTKQNEAFYDCDGITEISYEDGATVGTGMFTNCDGLTEVTIPENVTFSTHNSYGGNTFYNCDNITTVNVVGNNLVRGMFEGCDGLTTVNLGDNVTELPVYVFKDCTNLTSINFNKVTTIGQSAFQGAGLTGDLVIPEGVTSVGVSAFASCTGLTSITFPSTVTSIPNTVVNGCTGITDIYLADTVTTIGKTAFKGVDGVTIHYAGSYTTNSPWGATNATIVAD